ncbi:hypothetical protein COCSADRAFT_279682 [Bipolaris sorokiniana ND90Pr]|uniref:Uncharacterized protein n=1 Tax=Cochliobolus sativus (strain ND90Pr / ATCC 201652) TaxID=665912 RepID=M2SP12_COCSN|nr:uncharacterized protein COCSADRAFT_279682 [Bipolaris sorokiniana ND90Pr]EMD58497.1 hypothetical protein COCSADRAFT_279682 [Bipolaris sorokiniana ND90Pr]
MQPIYAHSCLASFPFLRKKERKKGGLVVGRMRAISSDVLSCRCISTVFPPPPPCNSLHQIIDKSFLSWLLVSLNDPLCRLALPTSK